MFYVEVQPGRSLKRSDITPKLICVFHLELRDMYFGKSLYEQTRRRDVFPAHIAIWKNSRFCLVRYIVMAGAFMPEAL